MDQAVLEDLYGVFLPVIVFVVSLAPLIAWTTLAVAKIRIFSIEGSGPFGFVLLLIFVPIFRAAESPSAASLGTMFLPWIVLLIWLPQFCWICFVEWIRKEE